MPTYDPKFIHHLLEFMAASDRAGFESACALAEAEYYKDRGFSFGSIHNLLVHQMVAQKTWLARWQGQSKIGRLENQTEYPTRALLAETWPRVHRELVEFAAMQTGASLNATLEVTRADGEKLALPLGAMIMHVADHGTYHRGQLASMITMAGAKSAYAPYFRFQPQHGSQS